MIRVLDPATAIVRPDQEIGDTAYVSDRLLVRGDQPLQLDDRVAAVLKELGLGLRPHRRNGERVLPRWRLRDRKIRIESEQVVGLELHVVDPRGAPAPDAWTVLQQIRAAAPDVAPAFELVHVLFATTPLGGIGKGGSYVPGIGKGGSYVPGIGKGGSYVPGIGMGPDEFGVPGYGGKAPVALVIADPSTTARRLKRPPVVVMPDTGIGDHPWFPDEAVVGMSPSPPASLGVKIVGAPVADRGPGVSSRLTGEFDRLAGHGTFIAGLVRQMSPEARLQSHAVMSSDGLVAEDDVIELLLGLLEAQLDALDAGDDAAMIDVLTLSFGCYHEDLAEEDADPSVLTSTSFATVLRDLGRVGVLVVAGAGNDATARPFVPAAFAGDVTAGNGDLPLVSVGSLNPNASKVSLFSNGGSWVTTYRHGAAIVSALPRIQNASSQASAGVSGLDTLSADEQRDVRAGKAPRPQDRATIDLDDYTSGFGVWSGTSFAAPVLAGEFAHALADLGSDATDLESMLKRGWAALSRVFAS